MLTASLKINGKNIGELTIVNNGKGSSQIGNYGWRLVHYSDAGELLMQKDGFIAGFDRKMGAWELVKSVLREAL